MIIDNIYFCGEIRKICIFFFLLKQAAYPWNYVSGVQSIPVSNKTTHICKIAKFKHKLYKIPQLYECS